MPDRRLRIGHVTASVCHWGEGQGPECRGTGVGLWFLGLRQETQARAGSGEAGEPRECPGRGSRTKTHYPGGSKVRTWQEKGRSPAGRMELQEKKKMNGTLSPLFPYEKLLQCPESGQ